MVYTYDGLALPHGFDYIGNNVNHTYDINGKLLPNPLKIMTYNVGEWYIGAGTNVPTEDDQLYYDLQNGMIATQNPDILFIQEYWKVFSQTGRTAMSLLEQHFPYIHEEGGNSGYYGHCLCSKYPINKYTTHFYSNDAERYYDSATITIYDNTIQLVNTHLGLTAADREVQIGELVSFLQTVGKFICAGDYNTQSKTELAPLLNTGFKIANCGELGYFVTSCGVPSEPGAWRGCIDNICVSSDIKIFNACVDETKIPLTNDGTISKVDHMPFIAMISI